MRMLAMIHKDEVVIAMSEAEIKAIINVMDTWQSGPGFEEYEQLSDILDRFKGLQKTIHPKEADTDA